jgi:EAL domain-containing protein (putative c-di-GMP-specific phosphodiesterase class I)
MTLHYQPIVRLDAHDGFAVESLVRWQDPEFGLVMPNEFIDLAETSDAIGALTQWTLDRCLSQCSSWRKKGHDITVASNLSPRLVQDAQFADTVLKCLERHDADPAWLTLEITENAIMSDPERALETAGYINRLGIQLSIDDFGTGYSSFAYLKHLPVHELKIDKSFILDMDKDQEDAFIVNSIITLAHGLGLKVVAEGVETETAFRQLRSIECDLAQGYWISRPYPAETMPDWRRDWQSRQDSLFNETHSMRLGMSGQR